MSFELKDELLSEEIGEMLVEEIAKKTGKSIQDVFSMISERQERMGNLLSFEVVALIVAREVGVNISDLIPVVERKIFDETPR